MRWWKGSKGSHVVNVVEDPSKMPRPLAILGRGRVEMEAHEGAKAGGKGKETGKVEEVEEGPKAGGKGKEMGKDVLGDKEKLKAGGKGKETGKDTLGDKDKLKAWFAS